MQTLPDAFIPDLEDSVAENQKLDARTMVCNLLQTQWKELRQQGKRNLPLMIPRVNNTETLLYDELDALLALKLSPDTSLIDVCVQFLMHLI